MRILTWNINGVRTLAQYHPWNTLPSFTAILDALGADILCFQELKSSRTALPKPIALPDAYDAFFSFPHTKTGYSGVGTYVRARCAVPRAAEEGLCGVVQPRPPRAPEERVSAARAYPQCVLGDAGVDIDFVELDGEGRALVLDFGLFVLVNVYCPNDGAGTGERSRFKAEFHAVLEARVRGLVEGEGREVVLVGDLNACAAVVDHCEGALMVARGRAEGLEGEEGFWGTACRRWMRDFLVPEDGGVGLMVDVTRRFWPDRKGMYTCWNTKISARESNYGTRIDYVMVTRGLLPWVKAADIQPHIKGSDHCPVYVDLHDEIVDSNGETIRLQDVMRAQTTEPPRIASRFWDEYSGKQRLLQQFFGKPHAVSPPLPASSPPKEPSATPTPSSSSEPSPSPVKRKLTADTLSRRPPAKKKQKQTQARGQATLASFFAKPPRDTSVVIDVDAEDVFPLEAATPSASSGSKHAWSSIMAPVQPPRCGVHGEPARELTVTKPGPNKGKKFFICSRPVGPGYDKGRAERRREDVDATWRCDFFKWSSEARREMRA